MELHDAGGAGAEGAVSEVKGGTCGIVIFDSTFKGKVHLTLDVGFSLRLSVPFEL